VTSSKIERRNTGPPLTPTQGRTGPIKWFMPKWTRLWFYGSDKRQCCLISGWMDWCFLYKQANFTFNFSRPILMS